LRECVTFYSGGPVTLRAGQPVLIGFPQDEGVRRNDGRVGAAAAPGEIRDRFYRLTPWDGASGTDLTRLDLLDLGNVDTRGTLEESQEALGEVVGAALAAGAIPVVLGGGHETAFGHYLGYVNAKLPVGIVNLDAHLDVRPTVDGRGHSGSPFRQALEHPVLPLPGERYACLGVQSSSISRAHVEFVREKGGVLHWQDEVQGSLAECFRRECERLVSGGCRVYVTVDADVVRSADVPGVSAPNSLGLAGAEVIRCVRQAGAAPAVCSLDVVEVNPAFDRDGQSARWAALAVWHFLAGLAGRRFA
jgi:formiminoglutamase